MQHLDPDAAGLAALGEPLDSWSQEHLGQCGTCSAEVDGLRSVVATAKADGSVVVLERPDPAVWDAIKAELGLPADLQADGAEAGAEPSATVRGLSAVRDRPARRRRQVSTRWLAVAAGVGILVGGGALWGWETLRSGGSSVVLAQAELDPLPGFSGSGEATISRADNGTRSLEVDLTGATPEGFRQVWLIAPDLQEMYSVGLMEADHGSFAVPADIDLARYPIVDVSDEPFDGDPTHSSVSMVRGTIGAVGG
ncbi:anti-sigma factor domain-containing protein [Arthrobacter antioxidans]|uniref:anti-sigma factor domain-containing protein n=1 Tax=Arthrobacter antioxidans TaxID=2895818 RepID=UPI001FFE3AD7|nr:anti-sigma factor [Arthrobacter antioxidans]